MGLLLILNEIFTPGPRTRKCAVALMALTVAGRLGNCQQSQPSHAPNSTAGTYSTHSGRPLAEVLLQMQQAFLSPINYEEVAYESPSELQSKSVVTVHGPKTLLFAPIADFSATLFADESTPYLAVHSALSQYKTAGLYGADAYQIVQQSGRLDIIPSRVLSTTGSWRSANPVMGHPVSFPLAERTIGDTLKLILGKISVASGKKMILLTQPFRLGEKISISASGELPGDIIAKMGDAIGATLSYQCLYDPSDLAYYVNIYPIAATVTGSLKNNEQPGTKHPSPNGSFFTKDLAP